MQKDDVKLSTVDLEDKAKANEEIYNHSRRMRTASTRPKTSQSESERERRSQKTLELALKWPEMRKRWMISKISHDVEVIQLV